MPDDIIIPSDTDHDDLPEGDKIDRGEVKKIVAQRQQLKAKLSEQAAKLKAYEDAEKAAKEKEARAAQDWATLEKAKDGEIAELKGQIDARDKADAERAKEGRQAKFVAEVIKAAGLTADDTDIVEGVLLKQERVAKMDIAPEKNVEALAKEFAKKRLRELAPRLFKTTDIGPRGVAGTEVSDADSDPRAARVREVARNLSSARPKKT